jgi:hypothetical protein
MNRRVNSIQLHAAGGASPPDTYFDKVVKYIPADIVAAWTAINGLVKSATNVPTNAVLWVCFVFGIVLTPLWTWKQTTVPNQPPATKQIAIAAVAFVVWVLALGPPFDSLGWYRPLYASLLLIGYTLVVGLVD